jgi:Fic family protein
MRELVKHKHEPLTPELICSFHRSITAGTLKSTDNEGVFRTNNDVVVEDATTGEAFYHPPGHEHLKGMMKVLCDFANAEDEKQFMHPIVRGIILHFLIGYIHPFVDGNGRTARALFYWYLLKRGYWLVEFLTISRIILRSSTDYAHAYLHTEYDENDLTYFIDFNLDAMNKAMAALKEHLARKMEERRRLPALLANTSLNSRQAEVLLWIEQEPHRTLTLREVSNAMRTALQTARNDLNGLVSKGFLAKRTVSGAEHFFASPNFALKLVEAIRG